MHANSLSNIPKKILYFFNQEAERIGLATQCKQRESKLTPSAFVMSLIATCLSQSFGLDTFLGFLYDYGITITKQSLSERFNVRTEAFLKELSSSFLNHFQHEKLPELNGLEAFTALNLIDSSSVSLHSSLSQLFKGSGGVASDAALKIQLMFDYLSGQIKELTLTSGCDNDQGFDYYFNSIQKGALYLMDLGYFKLQSFKKIIDGEAYFVSRLLTGTKLFTLDGDALDLHATLLTAPNLFSKQLLMGAKAKISVRLVTQRLPKEIADKRRQALRKGHKRRGITPSKELLALQSWSIYITNTNETQISNENIHKTYALRWQIELFFKLSKSLMHINYINTTKSSRVVVETYGKFISMMLFLLLCAPVRYLKGREVSFYKACKLLIVKVAVLISALSSIYRLQKFIDSFHQKISLLALKDIKKKPSLEELLLMEKDF
jgi:hypothetical protein